MEIIKEEFMDWEGLCIAFAQTEEGKRRRELNPRGTWVVKAWLSG